MIVFVTGANGQLGREVMQAVSARGHLAVGSGTRPVYACGDAPYVPLDITDQTQVFRCLEDLCPQAVIHCAAWTDVDGAEEPKNRDAAYGINVLGTRNLAEACRRIGCKLIYISTDYVFSGRGDSVYIPESQDLAPINYYGQTKLLGEQAVQRSLKQFFILRTSWVYGPGGRNFFRTMVQLGRRLESVRVVNDQIGRPTYTKDLARLIAELIESQAYGIYHATGEGPFVSWYDLCRAAYALCGIGIPVIPVSTAEYGASKARRPENSRLDTGKLSRAGFTPLPDWRESLAKYISESEL